MNQEAMQAAISAAKQSSETLKCGATIVRDGKVLAVTHNAGHDLCDASGHAEILALREAGKKLQSKRIEGATIYCTCEPCIMCLAAISYARIKKVVYGSTLLEVSPKDRVIDIGTDHFLEKCPRDIEIVKNFMKEECDALQEVSE